MVPQGRALRRPLPYADRSFAQNPAFCKPHVGLPTRRLIAQMPPPAASLPARAEDRAPAFFCDFGNLRLTFHSKRVIIGLAGIPLGINAHRSP